MGGFVGGCLGRGTARKASGRHTLTRGITTTTLCKLCVRGVPLACVPPPPTPPTQPLPTTQVVRPNEQWFWHTFRRRASWTWCEAPVCVACTTALKPPSTEMSLSTWPSSLSGRSLCACTASSTAATQTPSRGL